MKLFAVIVDNLGTRKAFAVRASDPAAALQRVLTEGDVVYFQTVEVQALDETLLVAPEANVEVPAS